MVRRAEQEFHVSVPKCSQPRSLLPWRELRGVDFVGKTSALWLCSRLALVDQAGVGGSDVPAGAFPSARAQFGAGAQAECVMLRIEQLQHGIGLLEGEVVTQVIGAETAEAALTEPKAGKEALASIARHPAKRRGIGRRGMQVGVELRARGDRRSRHGERSGRRERRRRSFG